MKFGSIERTKERTKLVNLINWWARRDLNPQPRDYESPALTVELQALQGLTRAISDSVSDCLPLTGIPITEKL